MKESKMLIEYLSNKTICLVRILLEDRIVTFGEEKKKRSRDI